jgi:acyl-CoA dehydrogenase
MNSLMIGMADGPTEVHKSVVARELLKGVAPATDMFPDYLHHKIKARVSADLGLD